MWDKDKEADYCREVNNFLTQSALLMVFLLLICLSELANLHSACKKLSF